MNRKTDIERLRRIASLIDDTYSDGVGINPVEGENLPRRTEVIEVTEKLLELVFPGFDRHAGTPNTVALLAEIRSEEYYVNMMLAWYYATALAKQWEATLPYIENRRLDTWVHNKTIQKAIESFRVTDEQKAYLRTLRI